jgi:hypothetical protein
MKWLWAFVILLSGVATSQQTTAEKPCIAFSPESDSSSNELGKQPLENAVMQSGDFEFYGRRHEGCWNVHVISLPITNAKRKTLGYAISHTVTDPQNIEVGHALTFGPDQSAFLGAMRKATADAIRNVRLAHSISQSSGRGQKTKQHRE